MSTMTDLSAAFIIDAWGRDGVYPPDIRSLGLANARLGENRAGVMDKLAQIQYHEGRGLLVDERISAAAVGTRKEG